SIVGGIIQGSILGVIYAAVYDSLPGGSSIKKGIVLSIGWYIILGLVIYATLATASGAVAVVCVLTGLISGLIWGAIAGTL
ncbi:hypothetical protein AKJ57_05665, partial [candidate division MSBL1 archaeon SCGC-AAA259A05]